MVSFRGFRIVYYWCYHLPLHSLFKYYVVLNIVILFWCFHSCLRVLCLGVWTFIRLGIPCALVWAIYAQLQLRIFHLLRGRTWNSEFSYGGNINNTEGEWMTILSNFSAVSDIGYLRARGFMVYSQFCSRKINSSLSQSGARYEELTLQQAYTSYLGTTISLFPSGQE